MRGHRCQPGGGLPLGGRLHHTFRSSSELQAARAVRQRASEPSVSAPAWSVPRRVEAMSGCGAVSASLGERHSVVLLESGRVMMCGDGVALLHQLPQGAGTSSEAVLKAMGDQEATTTPRLPCAAWFPALEGKHVAMVACGGQHSIVLSRGERLGLTLGRELLQLTTARPRQRRPRHHASSDDEDDNNDDGDGQVTNGFGRCDLVILTAGSALRAHRVVVSRRSRVLRELIAAEERPMGGGAVCELLLPDLKHDTALALREFLYTDTVRRQALEPGTSLPHDLLSAAIALDLPRLAAIAATAIPAAALPPGAAGGALPPSTIASDLGGAVGDKTYADVKFIASGKAIFAHRAMLAASSDYFRAMFRPGSFAGGDEDDDEEEQEEGVVEVVVPDSYVTTLRLLLCIYTGHLPGGDDAAFVAEDLLAADRFQLADVRALCESQIAVGPETCARALEAAALVHRAPRLAAEALRVACSSLYDPQAEADLMALVEAHPDIGRRLLRHLADHSAAKTRVRRTTALPAAPGCRTPDAAAHTPPASRRPQDKHHPGTAARQATSAEDELAQSHNVFPFLPLLAAIGFAALYAYSSKFLVLGPMVPVINAIGLAGLVGLAAKAVRS